MLRQFSAVCITLPAVLATTARANELSVESFGHIRKLILPTDAESGWSKISWMSDLFEARLRAAKEGKPLFVWSMAAEPLGFC